jgi:hypothetical protein
MRATIAFLILPLIAITGTASHAASRFDGAWSVSVITSRGDCAASYRYPMVITNGVVGNGGSADVVVRGNVAPSGAVRVVVSQGNTAAAGYGRLFGAVGRGSWRGASCSGSWTAERHNL